jgi:hypothetical protein
MKRTNAGYRKEWHLSISGHDWLDVRRAEVWEGEEELRNPVGLTYDLRSAVAEEFTRRILIDLCSDLWGDGELFRQDLHRACELLEEEFRCGTVVVVRRAMRVAPSGGAATPAPAANQKPADQPSESGSSQRRKKLTWVAVRLVDANNVPVANERYHIVLADGTAHDGELNGSGEAWLEDIEPGNCQISFPNLDAREWSA